MWLGWWGFFRTEERIPLLLLKCIQKYCILPCLEFSCWVALPKKELKQLYSVLLYQASLLSISPLKHVNLWDGFLPYFHQEELIRISLQVLVYYHCCDAEFTFLHWSITTKSTHYTPSPHMKKTHLTRRSKFYTFYCCKVTTSLLVLPVIFEEWLGMNEKVILEAHTEIADIKQR